MLARHEIQASLNYTINVEPKRTVTYFYEDEATTDIHEPGDDPRNVTVQDGWHRAEQFSVDKEGFSLHEFRSDFEKWEDQTTVQDLFYPQVVSFLKEVTGARQILVFDHTIRTNRNAEKKLTQETETSQRAPVSLVHCDYTSESAPLRLGQLFQDEAEDLLSRRVAFFNVWKPIRGVVEESPLAMCDVTTTCPSKDLFKLHLHYRDRIGENYVLKYSPRHRWWYFPRMTPGNLILLKTYDSEEDGRARFIPHSAFTDPTSPKDAPLRESIELRTIAFF